MKNHDFMIIEEKATDLANEMLPISIEELVEDEKLTENQKYRIDMLIDFAKRRYKAIYGVDWSE